MSVTLQASPRREIVMQIGGATIPMEVGRGRSAYQSYLATTADDPPLSEDAWSASLIVSNSSVNEAIAEDPGATRSQLAGGAASTGSGGLVRAVSPALTTPNIGAATGDGLHVTGSVSALGGLLHAPPVAHMGSSLAISLGHVDGYIQCLNAVETEITVPSQAEMDWKAGTSMVFRRGGAAGPLVLSGGAGVVIDGAGTAAMVPRNGEFVLRRVAPDVWSAWAGGSPRMEIGSPLELSPRSFLFAEEGLYQDMAGSLPASNDGDPVRMWADLTGNGYDAIAFSDASRPVVSHKVGQRRWIVSDGVDDGMVWGDKNPLEEERTWMLMITKPWSGSYGAELRFSGAEINNWSASRDGFYRYGRHLVTGGIDEYQVRYPYLNNNAPVLALVIRDRLTANDLYMGGSLVVSHPTTSSVDSFGVGLFARHLWDGSLMDRFSGVAIRACAVWNRALNDVEVEAVNGWMRNNM